MHEVWHCSGARQVALWPVDLSGLELNRLNVPFADDQQPHLHFQGFSTPLFGKGAAPFQLYAAQIDEADTLAHGRRIRVSQCMVGDGLPNNYSEAIVGCPCTPGLRSTVPILWLLQHASLGHTSAVSVNHNISKEYIIRR